MKTPRQKYNIFAVNRLDYGDGHVTESRKLVGTTAAVSPAQAVNNYKHRTKQREEVCAWRCDGARYTYLIAEPMPLPF